MDSSIGGNLESGPVCIELELTRAHGIDPSRTLDDASEGEEVRTYDSGRRVHELVTAEISDQIVRGLRAK